MARGTCRGFPEHNGVLQHRTVSLPIAEYERKGQEFFQSLYGETGDNVQGLLDKISPDMGASFLKLPTLFLM